jgi:Spy/CpxP family protein refolding chaperone
MRRPAFLSGILLLIATLACGGSADSPTAPAGSVDLTVAAELGSTGDRIAASEVGAVGLAFELEEGQRQAIGEALARARAALADLRARWRTGAIGAEAAVAEARAIRETLDAEIEAALTPEQLAELEARRAAFRPGLELTEDQRAAIRAIVDGWRVLVLETLAAVREEALTPREAAQALAEGAREARAALCDVLEPDQRSALPLCRDAAGG